MSTAAAPRVARCAPGQGSAVAAFVERVLAGETDSPVGEPLRRDLARVEAAGAEAGFAFVAHAGEEIAGAILVLHEPGSARLAWLAVATPCRHRGIGRALVSAALEECRAARVPVVTAWSFAFSAAAPRLFWEFGFRVAALADMPLEGRRRETVRFEKRLAPPPASV